MVSVLSSLILKILIKLIRSYQLIISPFLGPNCRFYPTCSQYGIKIIYKFGLFKGTLLTLQRILKCHPFN